ncbi:MAG: serine hydrolase [Bacteroidota bacterium]
MRSSLKLQVVTLVLSVCFLSLQTGISQTKAEKIDALLKQVSENGQFNGAVLVAENGKVIYKKGYGKANFEWDIPNAPDTKFRLGSITKQFTAMLILQLVQQGKIKLDGTITDYLPDYPKKTGDKITVHHLLTHTSGIPGYTEFPGFFRNMSRNPSTPMDFVKQFADSALLFEPGARWSYSNSAYFLLGVIIEKLTGGSYEQALQKSILDPLGMKNTGYDHHETILEKRATGYERNPFGVTNAAYLDMSLPYAAGSLYSTVEDLYIWDQALYTDKLLSPDLKAVMFQPHFRANPAFHYAYGWMVATLPVSETDSIAVIQHGGGINGFNTLICRFPNEKHLTVLLNNTGGAPLVPINNAITGILYNQPYSVPKRSLAQAFVKDLMTEGETKARERFSDLRKNQSDAYALSEREMNSAGYLLMQTGKLREAIAVLKLNAEQFPQSSNVYDSLGEAYMNDGNKELAIKNYEIAVKMDPTNVNGVEMLKKLKSR